MATNQKKTQIRTSQGVVDSIGAFKKDKRLRFATEAMRALIETGLDRPEPVPPYHQRYRDAGVRTLRREIGVSQEIHDRVEDYRAAQDITYEEAYMEFLLRGLEAWTGAPVDPAV